MSLTLSLGLSVSFPLKFTPCRSRVPKALEQLCSLKRGLVLLRTHGSEKSTTLAAMVNHINETRYDHIVTIEDPIEFVHNHKNSIVNQREVGGDTNSFAKAMKSILRQTPMLSVGEDETVSSALTLAETGHLVFATLHTNTAVSSINRIVDDFTSPARSDQTQLSMTLESVISQTLLPSNQGGRVLCMEIMLASQAIRALINEGKIHQVYSSIQSGQADSGMQTMNQSLLSLVNSRMISEDLAIQNSPKPDELIDMLSNRGKPGLRR